VIDDYDDEAVVDFELFFSGTELEFFTDCAKDCGTRFSCNEFDTSPISYSCIENIRQIIKRFFLFTYSIQVLGIEFISESDNLSFRDINKNNMFY